jgi:hypothetical protein
MLLVVIVGLSGRVRGQIQGSAYLHCVEIMQQNRAGAESTGWIERRSPDRISQWFAGHALKRRTNLFNKH